MLVALFLVGCSASTITPELEAQAVTTTPELAAVTATLEVPIATLVPPAAVPTLTPLPPTPTPAPPTETPTPTVVRPQPGTILTGDIEDSEDASGAVISFEISEDGTSITTITITLTGPGQCGGITIGEGGKMETFVEGPFPITEGKIDASFLEGGELKGQFTSPNEASGAIKIVGLPFAESCQFGPSNWSAKAK